MILVWWGAEDHLGRHAGQMIRSLQTSLPVVFTFDTISTITGFNYYSQKWYMRFLKIVNSFIFMITFNTAMSFSTAVILKGRNKRCWRLLLFLGNCVLLKQKRQKMGTKNPPKMQIDNVIFRMDDDLLNRKTNLGQSGSKRNPLLPI